MEDQNKTKQDEIIQIKTSPILLYLFRLARELQGKKTATVGISIDGRKNDDKYSVTLDTL